MLNYTCLAHAQLRFGESAFVCVCVLAAVTKACLCVCQEKQMMVYVERRVADDATLSKDEAFGSIRNQLCTFREGETPACPTTCHSSNAMMKNVPFQFQLYGTHSEDNMSVCKQYFNVVVFHGTVE